MERRGEDGLTDFREYPAVLGEKIVYSTSMVKPGFVRIAAALVDAEGRAILYSRDKLWYPQEIRFDGGAGVQIEKLKATAEPLDFDAFWAEQRRILSAVPVEASLTPLPNISERHPHVHVWKVSVTCAGSNPCTGYLSIPADASSSKRYPALAQFYGYGMFNHVPPKSYSSSYITFDVNAHGMELGRENAYYEHFSENIGGARYAFNAVGGDPHTAYFRWMSLRVIRAFDYLKTLPEWNGVDLWANGVSQGGLQAIWAAGFVDGLTRAEVRAPWCCDLAGASKCGRMVAPWRLPYVPAVEYYDPVHIASRIPKDCMVDIARAGLGDDTCPPPGLAVFYNSIPGKKHIYWMQGATHDYIPLFEVP